MERDTDNQVHARRIAANTLLLYLQTVVYYFAELISTRLVLAALGVDGFALFTAVILVATTLTFLNAVLSSAAQRFLSFAQGRADPGAAAESFAAALGIAVLVSLSIVALGETVGLWYVMRRLSVPDGMRSVAVFAYQFGVARMLLLTLRIPFAARVSASERMGFFAQASILDAGLAVGAAAALSAIPAFRIEWYSVFRLASGLLMLLAYVWRCRTRHPDTVLSVRFRTAVFRHQGRFFLLTTLQAFGDGLKTSGVALLVNAFAGPVSTAAWKLGAVGGEMIATGASGFGQAYFPRMVKLWAADDRAGFVAFIRHVCWISLSIALVLALPLLAFTDQAVCFWVNGTMPGGTVPFVRCFAVCSIIGALIAPVRAAILAVGRIAAYQIGQMALMIAGFLVAAAILALGGPPWSSVMAVALAQAFNFVYHIICLKSVMRFKAF